MRDDDIPRGYGAAMREDKSKAYIEGYIDRAREAQLAFASKSQEETDRAVCAIAKVVYDNAEKLAISAVEETGMGNVPDKTAKNKNKSKVIWSDLKGKPSRGIIERNEITGVTEIAKPVGVVAAITPCTNPIVTPMSNAMFALKGGNAIIITPHHSATMCSGLTVNLIRDALENLGLPKDLVQVLSEHSREHTRNLISMADIVIATGGMGMVKAAYSSGKPALGVGTGNVQCIIDRNLNLSETVPKIIAGRAFDNGIICSGEQSVICPDEDYDEVLKIFEENGCYVVKDEAEKLRLRNTVFTDGHMNGAAVGQNAARIAELAGIDVPEGTKVLVVTADGTGTSDVFSKEKMCPVIAVYRYDDFEDAISIAKDNLENEGKGHSVSIHSDSKARIEEAGEALSVSRFIINQICANSAGGSFKNGLAATNTLGCGSWGNNSISGNLTYTDLINVSRIAYYMKDNPEPSDDELWI
jgi:succinate-semialdehyde dehydrogenase